MKIAFFHSVCFPLYLMKKIIIAALKLYFSNSIILKQIGFFFFMLLLFAFPLRVYRSNQWDEWVVVGFCRQPRTGSLMLSFFNICAKGPKGGESVYSCHTEV